MAYKLKTTGIAANCTMCIAVDPDTGTIKDFASPAVTADMTVDAGVTIGTLAWDGNTRSYFKCSSNNIVKFGTNKPTIVHNKTTNTALSLVACTRYATPIATFFGVDSNNYFAPANVSSGGTTSPQLIRSGANFAGTSSNTAGEQLIMGFSAVVGGNVKGYRALHNAASMTVSPSTTLSGSASDISWALNRLCGRNDQAATTYTPAEMFLLAAFSTELAESDFDALRDDWFGTLLEVDAGDTTAPTLTSPTGTATGSTTASGSVSTDEANGTLYAAVTTSSTAPSAAQVQAGQDHTGVQAAYATSQAVSATGVQAVNATGLAASTTYYWHYEHEDAAGNDSAVVSSAGFTTDAAGGTSINPGAGTITITGYAPVVSQTSGGTITTEPLKNNTGTVLANETGATVHVYQTSGALVVTKTGQTTDASGVMGISDAAIVAGTEYRIVIVLGSGAEGMDRITAA